MASTVADLMTPDPDVVEVTQPVIEAARAMRTADAGDVIVTEDGQVVGILTDRDLALRVLAEGKGPDTPVRDACSTEGLVTVGPDTSLDQAVQLMRSHAVRRLPVVEGGRAVGVLSIGDLAIELDSDSALADISAAASNSDDES